MMWGNGYGMVWWMWLVMAAGTFAFWVVIFVAIRALVPGRGRKDLYAERPDALLLLKEALARGEVSPEEYEQRRRLIVDGR